MTPSAYLHRSRASELEDGKSVLNRRELSPRKAELASPMSYAPSPELSRSSSLSPTPLFLRLWQPYRDYECHWPLVKDYTPYKHAIAQD